jgi:hypothetical protein
MPRRILIYGLIAGLIAGSPFFILRALFGEDTPTGAAGMAIGFSIMLLAFSVIFLAIKRQRDQVQGGVIKFLPALMMGLGISLMASVIYALAWEASLALNGVSPADYILDYTAKQAKAEGLGADAIAAKVKAAEAFATQYADPLFRLPMSVTEIFPVGLIVSLISAGLLRNSKFMPAKRG